MLILQVCECIKTFLHLHALTAELILMKLRMEIGYRGFTN